MRQHEGYTINYKSEHMVNSGTRKGYWDSVTQ